MFAKPGFPGAFKILEGSSISVMFDFFELTVVELGRTPFFLKYHEGSRLARRED